MTSTDSCVNFYHGFVRHRRFFPKKHFFKYSLYSLLINLEDFENSTEKMPISKSKFNRLSFYLPDYLRDCQNKDSLTQSVWEKIESLGGRNYFKEKSKILFVGQGRSFGIYFSPINLYYCYHNNECIYVLAEVSNTPWNQRHYYLIDMHQDSKINDKHFHVSPFMDLNMQYYWYIKEPDIKVSVHLENHIKNDQVAMDEKKIFDATLVLKRLELSKHAKFYLWIRYPSITLIILWRIYWQALKLFLKRVPFVAKKNTHLNKNNKSGNGYE